MNKKIILALVLVFGISGQGILFSKTKGVELNKSFCGGSRGAVFPKIVPLVAEGKTLPTVIVDSRVELLSLIFRLAGNPEYNRCLVPSYNADVEKYFSSYKEHQAVKIARQLRESRGVSFDAVMSLAVHITEPGELKERLPLNPHPLFLDKRWPLNKTLEFLKAARAFAEESHFSAFFNRHRELYDTAVARLQAYLQKQGRFHWFDTFFGAGPGTRFTIILGMLNGPGSYGVRMTLPQGRQEIYSILGIWSVDQKGIPVFAPAGSGFDVMPTIIHEFCHSYINPLVNTHEKQLEKAGKTIFSYVFTDMKQQAYSTWKILIYESLVRGCVVRYVLTGSGPTAARKQIAQDLKRKFIWMEELSDLLGEYESDRAKYPNLAAFFPRFVTFFNEYAANNQAKLAALKKEKKKPWDIIKGSAPKIVSMNPANGAMDVNPNLQVITIVFDSSMRDHSWSVMRLNKNFPELNGSPKYDAERKVLTIPVKLEPGRTYEFGLNAEGYLGFCSEQGVPLVPVQVRFTTKR